LGALKLVGFVDDRAESDNPCWQFYVQELDQPQKAKGPKAETNGTQNLADSNVCGWLKLNLQRRLG